MAGKKKPKLISIGSNQITALCVWSVLTVYNEEKAKFNELAESCNAAYNHDFIEHDSNKIKQKVIETLEIETDKLFGGYSNLTSRIKEEVELEAKYQPLVVVKSRYEEAEIFGTSTSSAEMEAS